MFSNAGTQCFLTMKTTLSLKKGWYLAFVQYCWWVGRSNLVLSCKYQVFIFLQKYVSIEQWWPQGKTCHWENMRTWQQDNSGADVGHGSLDQPDMSIRASAWYAVLTATHTGSRRFKRQKIPMVQTQKKSVRPPQPHSLERASFYPKKGTTAWPQAL